MKIKKISIILLTAFFGSAAVGLTFIIFNLARLVDLGPGAQDFAYRLAGDYFLYRTSAHQVEVSPKEGWGDKTPRIAPKVIEVAWDERYVLAKQQALKRRSPDNPQDTYEEPAPGVFHYWILDTKTPQVIGPFSKEGFEEKRKALGIPDTLILRNVASYKSAQ